MKRISAASVLLIASLVAALVLSGCWKNKETVVVDAYDIAKKNGFVGSESEWLESLQGHDGKDGKDGAPGMDGKDGRSITVDDLYDAARKEGAAESKAEWLKSIGVETGSDNKSVIAKCLTSTVGVVSAFRYKAPGGFFANDGGETREAKSQGSGVIYKVNKAEGVAIVITNYHVIFDLASINKISDDIKIFLYGEKYYDASIPAKFVGGAMRYDIALLEARSDAFKTGEGTRFAVANLADSDEIAVGQTAIAIGNAQGKGISATTGAVCVDSENIQMQRLSGGDAQKSDPFRVVRVDCAVNPGNSGGGLFDSEGRLMGIVNAKNVVKDVENIGYALPANVVGYVAENILDQRKTAETGPGGLKVKKCILGIGLEILESRGEYKDGSARIIEKVGVGHVNEGALADGKLQEGDVIKRMRTEREGREPRTFEITRSHMMVDLMLTLREGDSFAVIYERDGKEGEAKFENLDGTRFVDPDRE